MLIVTKVEKVLKNLTRSFVLKGEVLKQEVLNTNLIIRHTRQTGVTFICQKMIHKIFYPLKLKLENCLTE